VTVKEIVSWDEDFFEGPLNQISTVCMGTDGLNICDASWRKLNIKFLLPRKFSNSEILTEITFREFVPAFRKLTSDQNDHCSESPAVVKIVPEPPMTSTVYIVADFSLSGHDQRHRRKAGTEILLCLSEQSSEAEVFS